MPVLSCRFPWGASLALVALGSALAPTRGAELVDCINPMIGATTDRQHGEGKTFPGAATPFGMVQLSPDTITGGDNGPGYTYENTTIEGFSFTHMSGVGWYGDLGNFMVMPTSGPLKTASGREGHPGEGYRSRFRHETEMAKAGYYAVTLDDSGVRAELTAAPRAGILRFTFPRNDLSRIQIDLARRIGGTSTEQEVWIVSDHAIEGWMKCPRAGGGWGNGKGKADYTVYFHAEFSRPFTQTGVWSADIPDGWIRTRDEVQADRYQARVAAASVTRNVQEKQGKHLGFFTEFATTAGQQVLMKSGISFVSVAGARANLEHDIPDWDFERVRSAARTLWKAALDRVEVAGISDTQKEVFSTALYHALLDPRAIADTDGTYFGADRQDHASGGFTVRTVFSGWDVFRSEMPLLTLIRPDIVTDEINSLMEVTRLSGQGFLPRWEFMGVESGIMIGDPAISVIAEAYGKGIRGFDVQEAYRMSRESAIGPKSNRKDLAFYGEHGWVPDSISWTLEDAYYDYCMSRFAHALGKTADEALFAQRAENYRQIYDPSVGSMRARRADGSWLAWSGLTGAKQGCVESNPFQQGWFVPQDVPGLVSLMGEAYFFSHLSELMEKTPPDFLWNDYYNHSDEPVHHVAYLFAAAGRPWLTQKWVRTILDHAYGPGVTGLCGNDDVGQMSAWYVLSAIGFHPVSPVDGIYVIGSPLFGRVTLHLGLGEGARTFTVVAHRQSAQNCYIQSATLNGRPLMPPCSNLSAS